MKNNNSLTIATLVAVLAVFVFSVTFAVAGGDKMYKKVPGKQHRLLFPEGHDIPATGCYYDDEEDVYFCSYEVEVQKDKNLKMMHKGGEPVFKKIPEKEHKAKFPKGHEGAGLPCFYDEEAAVYFCSYAE